MSPTVSANGPPRFKNSIGKKEASWATDLQQSQLHHLYSQGVWLFGDWYSAVAAAGLDPENLGLHTFWDKDRVIKEIKELKRRRLPLYPIYVMKSHPELFLGCKSPIPVMG